MDEDWKNLMGNLKKMQEEINEITDNTPVIRLKMVSRNPTDPGNRVYLNDEDITRYVRNINIDAGVDRITTATIVLSVRAIIEAPAHIMAYIRKEDQDYVDDREDTD